MSQRLEPRFGVVTGNERAGYCRLCQQLVTEFELRYHVRGRAPATVWVSSQHRAKCGRVCWRSEPGPGPSDLVHFRDCGACAREALQRASRELREGRA